MGIGDWGLGIGDWGWHYERKGVVHPERDPESGYRYYSLKDTVALAFRRPPNPGRW